MSRSSQSSRSFPRRTATGVALSQHLLRDASVARRIVESSGLAPPDLVYEAGAGTGILTAAIARRAGRVVAVEQHRASWQCLRERFAATPHVRPVLGDFLSIRLPRSEPYTVVSNVPFAITAPLMRRLLALPNPPVAAHLVLQREAAFRWAGVGRESVVSVLARVRFEFSIALALHRNDFTPRPAVDCVLLSIARRAVPLLNPAEERRFRQFVEQGFGGGRFTLRQNLGKRIGYRTFLRAARELGFDHDAAPGELAFGQWLELFRRQQATKPIR